ncbi:MAG: hypothetical protein WAM39_04050 [Bryobacteraceae bacterium]
MPDGDSLNWKVRGIGSRRVLVLARSGTDCQLVSHAAVQMFARQASKGCWKPAIREMAEALDLSLQQISPEANFTKRAHIFDSLSRRLSGIVQNYSDDGIRILERAAERTFGALEDRGGPLTKQAIEEELLCQSARAVVDHRVLQPTRVEIARECQRDLSEQVSYERELLSNIGQDARRLHRTFFVSVDPAVVRTPPRRVPKKETTLQRLSESLTVLPGGDQ